MGRERTYTPPAWLFALAYPAGGNPTWTFRPKGYGIKKIQIGTKDGYELWQMCFGFLFYTNNTFLIYQCATSDFTTGSNDMGTRQPHSRLTYVVVGDGHGFVDRINAFASESTPPLVTNPPINPASTNSPTFWKEIKLQQGRRKGDTHIGVV